MQHTSIKLETPCEFINVTPLNPLISKCQIKVCWVGDEPNRNKSIITKEVARDMANTLPGSPIVGYFNEAKGDFEEHNRVIDISNGKFAIKDTTRPYGFVDLGAKVWFQKFLDDGETEREYLMTEGYLWTGQYPEAQRIIDQGNNQSMELDDKLIDAFWTKDGKGKPQFFIINEAIISKLCVLGDDCEPCFEGSNITAPQITFSFEDGFKEQLFSMMNEIKKVLNEGGAPTVFTRYAVEIGDSLWSSIYSYLEHTYPRANDEGYVYDSIYRIEGIYEEGSQKFAILQNRSNSKYFRMNFSLDDTTGFAASAELVEVTKTYVPAAEPQFALADVEAFELEYAKKKKGEEEEDEDKKKKPEDGDDDESKKPEDKKSGEEDDEDDSSDDDDADDDEEEKKKKKKTKFKKDEEDDDEDKCPKCGKPKSECTCEDEDEDENKGKKSKYNLDEIEEYVELSQKYSALESDYNAMKAEMATLVEFKKSIEKKDKEAMIASFYMLSDEEKKDVIDNIDTYSLEDIEAKLSIICVRNKVNFNLDEDNKETTKPTTFSLDGSLGDDNVPAWVKSLRNVAKSMN
ncbi:MAG: hypothetical protein J6Q39_11905 [Bacteroidales bacterium]|nr:hypothetical protein [Bacteroidales bacterium]